MDSELEDRKDPNSEMTVSILRRSPTPNRDCPSVMTQQSNDSSPSSLERMKLESYIEKIITESPQSSDSTEDEPSSGQSVDRNPFDFSEAKSPSVSHIQSVDTNESIKNWLQRITNMQNEINRKLTSEAASSQTTSNASCSDFMTRNISSSRSSNIHHQSEKIVRYQDLPYMGEMTLDNTKPRRGRKPKKADICHLIYKNYGTIFPGTPESKNPTDRDNKKKTTDNSNLDKGSFLPTSLSKTDVQNKIISSLLEKRLTQETKRVSESARKTAESLGKADDNTNEPLNLCIRDMNQLKIRLQKRHSSSASTNVLPELKHELPSDDESEAASDTVSSPFFPDLGNTRLGFPNNLSGFGEADISKVSENGVQPAGYIYWPHAGVFIHPMALQQHLLYYQRMAASNNYTLPSHSPRPPPEGSPTSEKSSSSLRKIRPKKTEVEDDTTLDQKTKRNLPSADKTPTKRKRSAIFIPPIPSENQNNPATEVSIGKFKFTGGAKPTLQEKKMLSVDSGGNFRYYSGTGDKSMRGYEFFPRETLQQQIVNAQGSSTGAFLHASGEKIYPGSPDCSVKKGPNDFLISTDIPSSALSPSSEAAQRQKKRKSRKSLQREKLEQTFKEKGFLIQTQQLESAEGATYCKFRQLRKFTRYLFRSWKDYLPGNVRELQEGEEAEAMDNIEDFSNFQADGLVSANMNSPIN
ncbi:uncharacterized protein LOC108735085 isoform X2 [Agrilus planipennis]|nr:uncharacterized protein LOC108735085 isoform X2 [Agrilus planipennis]